MDAEEREKLERLIEATVALLENAPGQRMQITNLNKGLFYLDLAALRDTGAPLTRNVYLAMEQGPVMHGYREALIDKLAHRGYVRQDVDGKSKPLVLVRSVESYRHLDDHLRALAASVSRFVSMLTAKSASNYSHANPGWRLAYARGEAKGLSPAPIDMNLAMQQLMGDDPWLYDGEDAELHKAFDDAEKSKTVEW